MPTIMMLLLLGCSSPSDAAMIEMELTKDYDPKEPFVHANLFYTPNDVEQLALDITFEMEGKTGLLEIADNNTDEVVWSEAWNENTDKTTMNVLLENVKKETEYVIRFTGTGIEHAKIEMTSKDNLFRERAKPLNSKSNKEGPSQG